MASEEPITPAIETRLHWARSANPSPEDMREDQDDKEERVNTEEIEEEKEEVVELEETSAIAKEDTEIISAVAQVIASVRSSNATGSCSEPPSQLTPTATATGDSKLALASRKLRNIKRKLSDLAAEVGDVTRTLDGDDPSLQFLSLPESKRRRVEVERDLEKAEGRFHIDQPDKHHSMPQTPTHDSASPSWLPEAGGSRHPVVQSSSSTPMLSAISRNLQPTSPQFKSQSSSLEEHPTNEVYRTALQEEEEMEDAEEVLARVAEDSTTESQRTGC